ncbi:putative integral membrane protein [Acanthocheilonema viteae]|uniref:Uncharacterized protein n=1 Tax=Acanthocheilonema viteae TaxID=6277 RepID=A0A498S730_ACAVI|nr:unnamed protein product [Acanthocheilonema viteae]
MANYAPICVTKYFTALTIITILSITETNAQLLNFNVLSFNNNRAGDNSLNNNGNAGAGGNRFDQVASQTQRNPFTSWPSAVGAGLGLLTGLLGGSFTYTYNPYYSGYASLYRPTYYYYSRYPYFYYYRG